MADRRLTVELAAVTKSYSRGMRSAAQDTRGLLGDLGKVEGAGVRLAGRLGTAAAATGLAIAAGIGTGVVASIREFSQFDAKMTESLAIMGDVSEGMKSAMSDAAREIGTTTKFSADEAAEAYYFLASAGLDAAQSIDALPQVAAFAQAGMFDLATATDLATDAQSALGLAADDPTKNLQNLTRVTDVLVKANTLANASVQQFSEALTNKAGAALRILNKDVEEGVAVLAVYADQGLKGAAAGEALNIVLRDLQKASLENASTFEEFGISVFDAEGNMRGIADIIADVETATDGMSDATRKATLSQLGFQERSVQNVIALLGTSDAIRQYEADLRTAAGTTEDVAGKQLDTLSAQFELLGSKVKDIGIGAGEAAAPLVEEMLPALEAMIDGFGEVVTDAIPGILTAFETLGGGALELIGFFHAGANSAADLLDVLQAMRDGAFQTGDKALDLANAMGELERRAALTKPNFEKLTKVVGANTEETLRAAIATREWIEANEPNVSTDAITSWIYELESALIDETAALLLSEEATYAEIEALYGAELAGKALDESRRDALGAHWEQIAASKAAEEALGEEEGAVEEIIGPYEIFEESLRSAEEAQRSLADAIKEFTDPTFAAVKAVERWQGAIEKAAEVAKDAGTDSKEYARAQLDIAEAALEAQGALDTFDTSGPLEQVQALADVLDISDFEARMLLETLGLLDGTSVTTAVNVDTVYRTSGGGGAIPTAVSSGLPMAFRAEGGPLSAGQPAIVGERGPELFVPSTAGNVVPNVANSVSVTVNHPNTYGLDTDLQIGFSTAAVLLGIEAGAAL